MISFPDTRVLCCNSLAKGESAFAVEMRKAGYCVDTLPVINMAYHTPDLQEIERISLDLLSGQWLAFSSPHGVMAFCNNTALYSLLASGQANIKIGLVGKKTQKSFESYFSNTFFIKNADNFEDLLTAILKISDRTIQKIYHITSFESLILMPLIPPQNIEIQRRPLYRTIATKISKPEIETVMNRKYDLLFFSSPSTYVFFTKIPEFNTLLQKTPLAAAGTRTSDFIEQHGHPVSVVSKIPGPDAFVKILNSKIKAERLM